jgi:hypothetical protein
MRNPWARKNPWLSLWLSAANGVAGAARGHANAALQRQIAQAQAEMVRQMTEAWSLKPAAPARRAKKKRR